MSGLAISRWLIVFATIILGASADDVNIVASNATIPTVSDPFNLTLSASAMTLPPLNVTSLTDNPQNWPTYGLAIVATPNNLNNISKADVVFISCDNNNATDYPGNLDPWGILKYVAGKDINAAVFYSETSNTCTTDQKFNSQYIYSMVNRNDSLTYVEMVKAKPHLFIAAIGTKTSGTDNGSPAQGTALAMIILYAITGLITLLFILIIVTGAIRAHRHPERYGPRAGGRVKQSRVGGLARAMLDTIPIVKFGDRSQHKPEDAELASTPVRTSASEAVSTNELSHKETEKGKNTTTTTAVESEAEEGGIAAASSSAVESSAQGCSICTEDFELGQDQRVLPCDHRFHPACVDPWLLNISGTCPLCRVDLRPQDEDEEQDSAEASPATPASRRRRSVLLAITGLRGADRMSREERIQALRRYRLQRRASPPTVEEDAHDTEQPAEERERTQHRLARMFNVRTWRTA